jgi:DNA-binding PadR family transcriptional regulator
MRVSTIDRLPHSDEEQLSQVAKYLEGEGLIRIQWLRGLPAYVSLTHKGLREIEDAIGKPDEPTQYFMSINVLNIGEMINSTVQQGTIQSMQETKAENKC